MAAEPRAIRIISFSGQQEDWRKWQRQFTVVARVRGYKSVLYGEEVPPAEDVNLDPAADADQIRVRNSNLQAYGDLVLACTDDVSFEIIDSAVSDDLPSGDAAEAFRLLRNYWEPNTRATLNLLIKQYQLESLKNVKDSPIEWMTKMANLRKRLEGMNHIINDESFMIKILTNLPQEYESWVEDRENELEGGTLTIANLQEKLRSKYVKMMNKESSTDEMGLTVQQKQMADLLSSFKDNEMANFMKQFKKRCRHCGKIGHKVEDCWSLDSNKGKRPPSWNQVNGQTSNDYINDGKQKRKCRYCGKPGHFERFCWKKKKDMKRENANVSQENSQRTRELGFVSFCHQCVEEEDYNEKNYQDSFFFDDVEEEEIIFTDDVISTEDLTKENKNEKAFPMVADETANTILDKKGNMDTSHIWIGDSGASCHMTHSLDGMYDIKEEKFAVTIGDGKPIYSEKVGKWKGYTKQRDGSSSSIVLNFVAYIPSIFVNLFSITQALRSGSDLYNKKEIIFVRKGEMMIAFDNIANTKNGFVAGVFMHPLAQQMATVANTKLTYQRAHQILGHTGEETLRWTADKLNWKIPNKNMIKCISCPIAKARRKRLNKVTNRELTGPGDLLCSDISPVKTPSYGGSKFWLLIMDCYTKMKWSYFLKHKSDQYEVITLFIKRFEKETGIKIKEWRCDGAGENKVLPDKLIKENEFVDFEFTPRDTPQFNGIVERAFATLYGRVRAMLNGAKLPKTMREKLWAEAANTATKLDNILSHEKGKDCPYKLIYSKMPKYVNGLRAFGEIGIITIGSGKIKAKLDDRGTSGLFSGYPDNYSGDSYRMLNLKTKRFWTSRDIVWINKMYGDYMKLPKQQITFIEDSEDLEENEQANDEADDQNQDNNNDEGEPEQQVPQRLGRELRGLQPYNAPGRIGLAGDVAEFLMIFAETQLEPLTFQEAWHHPDPKERESWRTAIRLEFRKMIQNGVWRNVRKREIPSNRRLVGCKWVFKKKKNGVYRARLCALGYSQVPGVDFNANYSPVINDITFRILLVLILINDWYSEIIDIQTAFLYGKLEEEIYMKIPEGFFEYLEELNDESRFIMEALLLLQGIYGLVQSARNWFFKLVHDLIYKLLFEQCQSDPCLLYRNNEDGLVIFCVYVDDCCLIGDKDAVKKAIQEIKELYTCHEVGALVEYLGVTIERYDKYTFLLSQPDTIKKLYKTFQEEVEKGKYKTGSIPAHPGSKIQRTKEDDEFLDENQQKRYRSGVGMLLWLSKHTRPDATNAIRESSKVLDRASKEHYKYMLRIIKYIIKNRNKKLKIRINPDNLSGFELKGYSDSDYAGDLDTRRSVSGFSLFFNGALIAWRSRGQRSVSLSSTEAEFIALSEAISEILFVRNIIVFLGGFINLPIQVFVDNMGALYLAENNSSNSRIRHMEARNLFIREFIRDGVVEVVFVRSEDNRADILTKNVSIILHDRHCEVYMHDDE